MTMTTTMMTTYTTMMKARKRTAISLFDAATNLVIGCLLLCPLSCMMARYGTIVRYGTVAQYG